MINEKELEARLNGLLKNAGLGMVEAQVSAHPALQSCFPARLGGGGGVSDIDIQLGCHICSEEQEDILLEKAAGLLPDEWQYYNGRREGCHFRIAAKI